MVKQFSVDREFQEELIWLGVTMNIANDLITTSSSSMGQVFMLLLFLSIAVELVEWLACPLAFFAQIFATRKRSKSGSAVPYSNSAR